MVNNIQIIGNVQDGVMKLYAQHNDRLLDLGEAHKDDSGFWYFANAYEYPSFIVWALARFLYQTNHQGGLDEV